MTQGGGKISLTQPNSTQENDVGPAFNEAESGEVVDLGVRRQLNFPGGEK